LIDPEPDDLLANVSLSLNLKAGIAATAYGPVLFLIWWIPPIVNGRPSALYEQVMNPLYFKNLLLTPTRHPLTQRARNQLVDWSQDCPLLRNNRQLEWFAVSVAERKILPDTEACSSVRTLESSCGSASG
jgi:hypothetical protein